MKDFIFKKELIEDINITQKTLEKLKLQSNEVFYKLCKKSIFYKSEVSKNEHQYFS